MRASCSARGDARVHERLGQGPPDAEARIERVVRVLEDELRLLAEAQGAGAVEPREVLALEGDPAGRRRRELQQQARDGRLAAAGFPDEARALAALEAKIDAIDRAHHAPLAAQRLAEAARSRVMLGETRRLR